MNGELGPYALVIGEALVDVIIRSDGSREVLPGGSPMNVAVGLARLNIGTVLHSRFGSDAHGRLISAHLAESEVQVLPGSMGARSTSVAEATIAPDGSASYVFDVQWDPQPMSFPSAPSVAHTGSIGAILRPGSALVDQELAAVRSSATITYDPNIRPQLMGERAPTLRRVLDLIEAADVVKASDEDIQWLLPDAEIEAVATDWLARGPSLVVITRGPAGAYATSRAGSLAVAAPTVPVVDTVGAGDSFMAGLIAALHVRALLGRENAADLGRIDLDTVREVVEFAVGCAAVTVSRRGANPPRGSELATGSVFFALPR